LPHCGGISIGKLVGNPQLAASIGEVPQQKRGEKVAASRGARCTEASPKAGQLMRQLFAVNPSAGIEEPVCAADDRGTP
jgi:hypothetical protein